MLDAVHRRRAGARLRCGGECGRNARCASHSRHPWGTTVSGPAIPFVALGSQSVNGGGAGRVHRYGRQRDPICSRDRPKAAQLTVFQRTPIWIAPRFDFPFTPEQHELFERDPATAQKLRDEAFDAYESASFDVDHAQTRDATELARSYLMRKVADPELRAKLTPDYPAGCKRPLMSRDWYPTFALPNVRLETTAIAELTERGVRTVDGVEHRVDTVIYGTGFTAADYLASI